MKARVVIVAVSGAFLLAAGNLHAAANLTVEQARAVVTAAETGAKRDDIKTSALYHSDDYVLKVSNPKPDGSRSVIQKNKHEVVAEMTEWLKHVQEHRYDSGAPVISILGSKARASFRATESFIQDGRHIQSGSEQVETIELRNGRPLITSAEVKLISLVVDGKRIY